MTVNLSLRFFYWDNSSRWAPTLSNVGDNKEYLTGAWSNQINNLISSFENQKLLDIIADYADRNPPPWKKDRLIPEVRDDGNKPRV